MMFYAANLETWILVFRALAMNQHEVIVKSPKWIKTMNLVSHYGSNQFNAPELMKESLVAVFFIRWFRAAKSQTEGDDDQDLANLPFDDNDMNLALFVHKMMRIVRFNCHEVTAKATDGQVQVEISSEKVIILIMSINTVPTGHWFCRQSAVGIDQPLMRRQLWPNLAKRSDCQGLKGAICI